MKRFIERIERLERQRNIGEREELPSFDIRGLTEEQREFIRDGARMTLAMKEGRLPVTEERLQYVREGMKLLYSCPPFRGVTS